MDFPHLHLLLNHFPIIGTFIAFGLFVLSFFEKNKDTRRISLIIFATIALLTIPTFLSGMAAQAALSHDPAFSMAFIQRHEGAALLTLALMLATGAVSIAGLWQTHGRAHQTSGNVAAILILSVLTIGMVIRTGNTGGDIRHSEIRDNPTATTITEGTFGSIVHIFEPDPVEFGNLTAYNKWCTAVILDLHFFGMALLMATVGILDLRIMGFAKDIPLAPLHQFIPWALVGLGINIVTGMALFMGSPALYNFDAAFWLKMLSLMLLGANVAVFYLTGIFEGVEQVGPGQNASVSAKVIAVSSLILWAAMIAFGRHIQAYSDTIPIRIIN